MDLIEHCPICTNGLDQNAEAFMSRPIFQIDVGVVFEACARVTYARCQSCRAYVQSPRMTPAHIEAYYGSGLYREWLSAKQEDLDMDERIRAIKDATFLLSLLGGVKSHLDIGSSRGYFLAETKAERQVGIEPNVAYNLNTSAVIYPSLGQMPEQEQFEMVSMIHSLEHTIDPMQALRDAASWSKRWLVIEVPSEKSKGGWGRLAHTFHFAEETLIFMAESLSWKMKLMYHTPHTLMVLEKPDEQ